ncbi:hypothetical protein UlMin_014270 [Ulmus minor]
MANEEDERREAALASTPFLQPDFNPKGVNHKQLSKFQELHKRRLELKSKSKFKKKPKDGASKCHSKDLSSKDCANKDSSSFNAENHNNKNKSILHQECVEAEIAPKQRQKLHWGLDTKDRWERKANM